ncbi:uncharacterized protein BKCO1_3000229 [Diplodia corticola]|uniref:Zn(2)-C6 fungal-type domain-containing protein n=1 Tax=Diplodia corticola TaxID=236234 RepID=A0A1J9S1R4_9PEZI|nr:uncharacterized protein BKCO1_3000229 [Diplodia corticola]OJD38883.1 hypothetical protein BKCO1_3000229 [Diplodia corticola]
MKVAKACRQCRESKRKCTSASDAHCCTPCQRKQLPCSLAGNRSRQRAPILPQPPLPASPSPAEPLDGHVSPSQTAICELVDLYITLIHDKPHSLFHEPTIRQAASAGSISNQVLCGISALFHENPAIRAQGTAFAQEAKRLLKEDVENICIANVQACILVANVCGANNEATSEALFFGIAIRMAQILSLPQSSAAETAIDQEVKRRVYWTLYMVDRWNSAGLGLNRQLPDALKYPMPVHELQFHQPHFCYRADAKPGLWAYFINLASIFGEIQDLHSRHVSGELEDSHFEEQAQALAARLEQFAEGLPTELRLNVDNLRWHADRGIGRTFVALHLGFHHYSTLIHFQYLDIQLPRSPTQRLFASRCKHHANTYSDLLKLSTEMPNCDAVYNIVGHMTVVSSSVLLHILFFGDEEELAMTRQRLEQNFQLLIKLRGYWPSVHGMMDRLFTFQKACMWTADPNTHKIDKWMLKFLLQHALPIEDKVDESPAASRPSASAVTPVVSDISSERGQYATNALSMLRQ